jgi:hypothetical protein
MSLMSSAKCVTVPVETRRVVFKKIASINLGGSAGINTKALVLYRGFFYGIINAITLYID